MTRIAFLVLTTHVAVSPVAAGSFGDLASGTRVRLHYRETLGGDVLTVKGELRAANPEGVTLLDDHGTPVVVTANRIMRLETYGGRHDHALVGAASGAAFGLVGSGVCLASGCGGDASTVARATVIWAGVGGLVGYLTRGDRWVPVGRDGTRLALVPLFRTRAAGMAAVVSWK